MSPELTRPKLDRSLFFARESPQLSWHPICPYGRGSARPECLDLRAPFSGDIGDESVGDGWDRSGGAGGRTGAARERLRGQATESARGRRSKGISGRRRVMAGEHL